MCVSTNKHCHCNLIGGYIHLVDMKAKGVSLSVDLGEGNVTLTLLLKCVGTLLLSLVVLKIRHTWWVTYFHAVSHHLFTFYQVIHHLLYADSESQKQKVRGFSCFHYLIWLILENKKNCFDQVGMEFWLNIQMDLTSYTMLHYSHSESSTLPKVFNCYGISSCGHPGLI